MKKFLGVVLLLQFINYSVYSQVLKPASKLNKSKQVRMDSSNLSGKGASAKETKNKEAQIEQYLIMDSKGNTTFVDTSLTIQKEYKFNYLRKDNFELLPFANLGQTYNSLSKDFSSTHLLPLFGARARHFNYYEVEDIKYYEVPTPLTELLFKTAFKQGQLLDALFTVNTSKQFNFSLAYKGMRSLGNYQHVLTSTGNLRFTTNYKTKNNRYSAKAHMVWQDLLNQENGGLRTEDLENFTSGDEDFLDRSVFDPNFENAENILVGKRFHLNQRYAITKPQDSIVNSLSIVNVVSFEDKYFQFDQTVADEEFFGSFFNSRNIRDRVTLEDFHTNVSIDYLSQQFGRVVAGLSYNDINYGYDKITILSDQQIPNRIKDKILSFEGQYTNQFGDLIFNSTFGINLLGDFDGSHFLSEANYKFNDDLIFGAVVNINSSAPNYNLLLNQSNYLNYNWNNINNFENQNNFDVKFELKSKKYFNMSFNYTSIDNYSLFTSNLSSIDSSRVITPTQINETISLYKIKLQKELKFGKFALDNTILYQNVDDNSQSLNVPDVVIRNTFYYSNHFFSKKALFLQTGITFNYFTDYYMDGYDPLLAEFYSQNTDKISGFPRLDFFINAKIRQTRIFIKAEHFNASFTGYDYFTSPNTPYRDFNLRFGLVWNFFL